MLFRKDIMFALLALLVSAAAGRGQLVTNVIDRFDTNSYPNGSITNEWSNWFGGAFQSLSLDPVMDAATNPASGALKIVANFPVATDQFEVWNGINGFSPAISGFQFTNFSCDVRFAAGSATNSSGKFGNLEFGVPTPGYGQNYFGSIAVSASNTNWVHVSIALNANSNTNLKSITGLLIHIWGAGLVGASTVWVDNIQFIGNVSSGTAIINYTNTAQRIEGFGASSAWDSTWNTQQADIFFSTNTGAGLSLLRTRIAPDGSTVEGGIAQMAQARGSRVWSTPWSPTANFKITNSWIRTNNSNSLNGGWISNSVATFQGYASQLAKNVALMKNTYGVNLYALSIQNEPDANVDYESCQWSAKDFHDFLPYLDAALTASNVSSTKIMLPESMHWQFNHATNVMSDGTTSNLVDILGGHNYGSSAAPVNQFGTPCPKTLWETEHYFGSGDDITNGLALAEQIHSFLTVAEASAYHYWWLKTFGGNGCLAGDSTIAPAKRLYTMGNYSRFVRPDFYRIGLTNTSMALVTAFKEPGSSNFVIVAANNSPYAVNQTFTITNFPVVGPLRQWVTSATESLANRGGAVSVTNNTFAMTLPPWTVTTFVYQPPVAILPTIWQQPISVLALPGDLVSYSVQASGGTAPLSYQWWFNGTNRIAGATNATLTLANAALTDAGNYTVIVTNSAGSVTSSVVSLTFNTLVWAAPQAVIGSADIATNGTLLYAYNNSGGSATVNTVTFTGVNSSAAWGTNIALSGWNSTSTSAFSGGANAPWSALPSGYKTLLQGGAYNNGGAATVTLKNLAVGHQYQVQVWVNDSRSGSTTNRTEILPGASNSTVMLAYNSTYAGGGVGQFATGTFTALATNQSFTLDSDTSTQINALQVRDVGISSVNIVGQPASQTNCPGTSATFFVLANPTNVNYAWQFSTNGGAVWIPVGVGGTDASYTAPTNAISGTQYRVAVSDFYGTNLSDSATLTFFSAPVIVQQPVDQTSVPGGAAVFSVQIGGGGTPAYQWRRGGTNLVNGSGISGATSSTLVFGGVTTMDNGSIFDCVVGNGCQFTNSATATLTVTNLLLALRYSFEDIGAATTDSVHGVSLNLVNASGVATDLHGGAGSGVAGIGRSLDFTSSTGQGGTGPLAFTTNNTTLSFGSFSNFTISVWMKPAAPMTSGYPRFLILGPAGMTDGTVVDSLMMLGNARGTPVQSGIQTYADGSFTSTSNTPPYGFGVVDMPTNRWTFLAATYDGLNWRLYGGTETSGVNLVSQEAMPGALINLTNAFSLFVGNRSNYARAFKGNLDDVRFYLGAANLNTLEEVRIAGGGSPPVVIGPADAPQLFATVTGGQLVVHITNSLNGVLYILETTPNLAPALWWPLATNVGNGAGLTNVMPIQSGTNQFFRHRLAVP